MKPLLLLMRIH